MSGAHCNGCAWMGGGASDRLKTCPQQAGHGGAVGRGWEVAWGGLGVAGAAHAGWGCGRSGWLVRPLLAGGEAGRGGWGLGCSCRCGGRSLLPRPGLAAGGGLVLMKSGPVGRLGRAGRPVGASGRSSAPSPQPFPFGDSGAAQPRGRGSWCCACRWLNWPPFSAAR